MPIYKKWFCEELIPGKRLKNIKHCFFIKKLVYLGKSPYQKILIFDNPLYGRILVLDDIVQFSQTDEFIYHEMITHPILLSHPKPEKVLIIGGGDGGVLREVLKHKVKKVWLVEIDKKIIKLSKKYFPSVSKGAFEDKRVKIIIAEGKKFLKDFQNFFDVIIIDSNDPLGPSLSLFSLDFYRLVFNALRKNGMMMRELGSFLDFQNLIKPTFKKLKKIFPYLQLFKVTIPSYHCGQFCFLAGSKKINLNKFNLREIETKFKRLNLKTKYYTPQIHYSSMIIPKLWQL